MGVIDQSKDEKSIHLFQHWHKCLRFSMECDGLLVRGKEGSVDGSLPFG